MGQYYRPITKDKNGKITVYSRAIIIDCEIEYEFAKLTEHSWIENYFMNSFCAELYAQKEPKQIVWLGDYANEFMAAHHYKFNNLEIEEFRKLFRKAWSKATYNSAKNIPNQKFDLTNKYIVNHTKQEYLEFNQYYQDSLMKDGWCLHPLSILTCVGNGCGGGDYRTPIKDSTFELVGSWAWDLISIQDNKPENYKKITPIFKERSWNEEE